MAILRTEDGEARGGRPGRSFARSWRSWRSIDPESAANMATMRVVGGCEISWHGNLGKAVGRLIKRNDRERNARYASITLVNL